MSIDGINRPQQPQQRTPLFRPAPPPQPPHPVNDHNAAPQFVPPQQVANNEQQLPHPDMGGGIQPGQPPKKRSVKQWLASRTKKQWIIFGVVAALLICSGVTAFVLLNSSDPVPTVAKKTVKTPPPPPPTSEASNLTGLQVGFDINKRPVTAIMIENSEDARPQSGMDQAGVVFEAVAEGGITRFLTLYQDTAPDYVGPVRSVRPYYIEWLLGFDAPVAHVGGSAQALALIKQWNVKDLDQGRNGAYFRRITSRYAPHNVYTSMAQMLQLSAAKGFTASQYTGFARKAKEEPAKTPNARVLNFNISGPVFNPQFIYDPATNSYARSQAGAPHMIVNGAGVQAQIKPKVVIAMTMAQGHNGIYTTYGTLGTGHAYIFQDGMVIDATWHKSDKAVNYSFTDAAGKIIKLNPGQAWISVVGSNDRVAFTP